jgi:hypothetical protein
MSDRLTSIPGTTSPQPPTSRYEGELPVVPNCATVSTDGVGEVLQ